MQHDFYHRGRSRQIRADWPEHGEQPHPRMVEMAEFMREQGSVQFKDLLRAGFTVAEITEHAGAARTLATEESVRHVDIRPDLLADIIDKAKIAMPNRPPLPRGMTETQAVLTAWSAYCRTTAALAMDPWPSQRERCLAMLRRYLDRSELFDHTKRSIVEAVAASYPAVAQ